MTPEEARAIVNQIGNEALSLLQRTQEQGEFTDRDAALLTDLWARYVDYLDRLDTDPIPILPFLDGDRVAEYVLSFME